ncbi:hypothetical protein Btru_061476 [Bulinus truncatus]|nr:hypothetical protein Btru_061476 [Bulinus truncatus]
MEHELMRLRTFINYPLDSLISSIILAREGFIFIGQGNNAEIKCVFCDVTITNLNHAADIKSVHARLSPSCPVVIGQNSSNITWSSETALNIQEPGNSGDQNFSGPFHGSKYIPGTDLTNDSNTSISATLENGRTANKNNAHTADASASRNISPADSAVLRHFSQATDLGANSAVLRNNTLAPSSRTDSSVPEIQTPQGLPADLPYIAQPISQSAHSSNSIFNQSRSTPQAAVAGEAALIETDSIQTQTSASHMPNSNATLSHTIQTAINSSYSSGGPGPTYSELGIITERPKRPEYALKQKRRETFTNWPRDHHLSEDELAEAGFYYAGYGDCARCFYCGGGLRNWEDEDDVWIEHARWFPRCAYIRGKLGQNVIDIVQDLCKQFEQISMKTVNEKLGHPLLLNNSESSLMRDPAVKSMVELGYKENDVLAIASLLKAESIPVGADVLLQKLQQEIKSVHIRVPSENVDNYSREEMRELKEKNNQLRQQTVCKICLDQEVAVVFLPCGHLVSCTECATAMKDCPVCRTNVKGIVRAFIN